MSTRNQRKKELDYAYVTPGTENQYLKITSGAAAWATIVQGVAGVQGFTGISNSGNMGFQGYTGFSEAGPQGLTGAIQGASGVQGADNGVQGFASPIVDAGPQGFQGVRGPQGTGGRIVDQSAVLIQQDDAHETFTPVVRIGAGSKYAFEVVIFWSGTIGSGYGQNPPVATFDFDITSSYNIGAYGNSERSREEVNDYLFSYAFGFLSAGGYQSLDYVGITQRGWSKASGILDCDSTTDVSFVTTSYNPNNSFVLTVHKGSYIKVYKLS